jgi:L-cysteine:1D-myo-inositol 2-amino-2-deoxy-alpha-D-glucopyranoside ligase
MLHLYDTATHAVRPLEPRDGRLGVYVCGITPYDSAHLGHAFTYHVFDVVARRLRAAGVDVRVVRNITDSDDDIFRVARERHVDHRALVAEQVARFDAEIASIGIARVDVAPAASDHVAAMIGWISRLESSGFAYEREGWVYFDVDRFDRYGALSGLSRDEMLALGRERGADPDDPRKDDPLDFVLWQPSLPDELAWEAPWGAGGRPGWHIECSVIASTYLGDGIDLHGGGDDLVYPHHECEIAQAEAIGPHPFARQWAHVAMVRLDGTKMSKSLGNLVFTSDLVARAGPGAVRLLLNAHHWRTSWEYSESDLADAAERLDRYRATITAGAGVDPEAAAELERAYFERIDDNLDTSGALRVLDRIAAEAGTSAARSGSVRVAALLPRLLDVVGVGFAVGAERQEAGATG